MCLERHSAGQGCRCVSGSGIIPCLPAWSGRKAGCARCHSEDVLLVPQGWLADEEQLGWLDTTVFQRGARARRPWKKLFLP